MSTATKVLVVDDEQVVLDSVRLHLKRENYEIQTVLSAKEALKILEAGEAQVVITDLMMPEMNGLELLEWVRKSTPEVPVIMITGYATMKTALQALRKGAFDYIAKPFTRAELQGVVARAARQAAGGSPAEAPAPALGADGTDPHLHLGGHCWIQVEPDRTARIGIQRDFAASMGEVVSVELPAVGDYLEQGSVCLRFLTTDGRSHTVWSPLSGSVVELNRDVQQTPAAAVADPYGKGWLLRLDPSSLDEELRGLDLGGG